MSRVVGRCAGASTHCGPPARWALVAVTAAAAISGPMLPVEAQTLIGQVKPWQAIPLPAPQSDPPETVRADSCAIVLTGDHVSMEMSVTPTGDTPALLLGGSRFGWTPDARYPNPHFPELQIRIDGVPHPTQDRYEAFVGGRNITTMLRLTGMDPLAVTRTPPLTSGDSHNAPQLKALVNVGAVQKSGDDYLAKWQVRRIVRIPLEPAPLHRVTLEYEALPAVSAVNRDELDTVSREMSYCLSAAQLRHLPHLRPGYGWQATEYTLPTGIDRKAVKPVTLTLSSGAGDMPREYVFFCGSHDKPTLARGGMTHGIAAVDELGNLHVLRVAEAAVQ